ncbi:MAG: hypothetical protein IJI10_09380 [Eubacterium sp.]|nr:hypothetical protein [Eubacterium sp.]
MKKRIYGILMAAAVLSIATAGLGKANAYFTTYATAAGSNRISLGDETTVHEDFSSWTKTLTFTNSADSSHDVYIRARAFYGDKYEDYVSYEPGEKWILGDDKEWYYFTEPVAPGEAADEFVLKVGPVPDEIAKDLNEYNVVVVYETIPAADASYADADWSQAESNGWTKQ